ncbi:riboflavin biosynthesis protein RibF [Desulfuribacillus stibiiarsenatis]|uniref:riboflavin biosynthesis protein RibF n=1 Tax=Desulfuribacillus stibiiarsenatis TaxID=1390249 RepID=UPI000AFEC68D|nr:riboflavin biosynthesis protein RibF [Desulfuribacillus stibiiarsenatis]
MNPKFIHLKLGEIPAKAEHSTCLALGNFDGVHIGHQKLIQTARNIANQHSSSCSLMTFLPHPRKVVNGNDDYDTYITPWELKCKLLYELGVDLIYLVDFNEGFAQLSSDEFESMYLHEIQPRVIVVGDDFRYGRYGFGNSSTLLTNGLANNIGVEVVSSVLHNGVKVSSSFIRDALSSGHITTVTTLLNRPYQLKGKVVHGSKLGRTIGFPTANINLTGNFVLPKFGVYLVQVTLSNHTIVNGIMNIGVKPTVQQDNPHPIIEIHLLDFNQDIYDSMIEVDLIHYIREEMKFNHLQELSSQIRKDLFYATEYLAKHVYLNQ